MHRSRTRSTPSSPTPSKSAQNYPYDINKAKELIAKSSAPKGFDVTILIPSEDQTKAQMMAVVKQLWAQIGVNVTIQNMETNALFTKYMNGDYEASDPLPSITSDVLVPDELALAWLDPNGVQKGFWCFYKSPKAWTLTLAANSTTNEAKRKQLFGQLQRLTTGGRTVGAALLRAGAHRAAVERPELPHARERLVEPLGGLEELR